MDVEATNSALVCDEPPTATEKSGDIRSKSTDRRQQEH